MSSLTISPDGLVRSEPFTAWDVYSEVRASLDELVGSGWIIHQIDVEVAAASLMKIDGAPRNHHAEEIIQRLGVTSTPMFFGRVALIGLNSETTLPAWRRLTSLDEFYIELITREHQLSHH